MNLRGTIIGVAVCAACGSSAPFESAAPAVVDDQPVVISTGAHSGHQQETTLARAANGRIVVVWIGFEPPPSIVTTIEYTVSSNGGATWNIPLRIPIPSDVQTLSDPAI